MSGLEAMDEKKRKRKLSNRESAKRSRMKKQKLVEDLTAKASRLQVENKGIADKIEAAVNILMMYEANNNVLRDQVTKLSERLKYLNQFIAISETLLDDNADDVPDDHMMLLWQLPCPMQADITTDEVPDDMMLPCPMQPVTTGVSDDMMMPRQLPCPMQPVYASSAML